jgi:sugar lactone lactonase YvrE
LIIAQLILLVQLLFKCCTSNNRIRKITPSGEVSTIAGGGIYLYPSGLTVDTNGNIYVAETSNNRIIKINPSGIISIFAGNGTYGHADGPGDSAMFRHPKGLAVDGLGNVYVADASNNCIRKITPSGEVSTFAGDGSQGFVDGLGTSAKFFGPYDVAIDNTGNIYVTEYWNNIIRKITPSGDVRTIAGDGTWGFANGPGVSARFQYPDGIAIDSIGNIYVTETETHRIRKISLVE